MNVVKPKLESNEEELFRVREAARSHFLGPIGAIALAILVGILNIWFGNIFVGIFAGGLAGITLVWTAFLFIPWQLSYLMVTNLYVRERKVRWSFTNFIGKQDIPINQISARRIDSSVLQTMLRVGDICIDSSAAGNIMLPSVARTEEVLQQINHAQQLETGANRPQVLKKPDDWLSAPQILELIRSEVAAAVTYHFREMQHRPVEERLKILWETRHAGGLTPDEYNTLKAAILAETKGEESPPQPSEEEPESPATN